MQNYNGHERRQPLSGISKQTFIDNAREVFGGKAAGLFGLLYDMQRCTDSKVELANEKIEHNLQVVQSMFVEVNNKCADCVEDNDDRYIKRMKIGKHRRLPFSMLGTFAIFGVICLLIGLGILELKGILNLNWLLKL